MRTRNLWIILWCLLLRPATAADTLFIDHPVERVDLQPYARLYIDTTGEKTIESLLHSPATFRQNFAAEQHHRYPSAYWLRIPVAIKEAVDTMYLLAPGNPKTDNQLHPLDFLDMYVVDAAGRVLAHEKSGYYAPRSEKSLPIHPLTAAVPFSPAAGDRVTLFLRLQNASLPPATFLNLELLGAKASLPAPDFSDRWIVLGPWGMFIIIGLYFFVFYFFVRDPAYLYFGLFCLFYSLDLLALEPSGGLSQWIPEHPRWVTNVFYAHFFCIPFLLLFGWHFVDLKTHFPQWTGPYRLLTGLFVLITSYYFIRNFWMPYQTFQPIFAAANLLIIPFCIRFLLSRNLFARIFAFGYFVFIAGNLTGVFIRNAGYSNGVAFWTVGQLGLLFILAIGLGYKLLDSERQRAAAEKIRELDALKTRFFTNISHEFRTPLSLILGPLQKAEEGVPLSEAENDKNQIPVPARHLQVMKRNALRLQQLIDQILDLAKIESGKMKLQLQRGEIVKFIRSRVAEFEDIARQKGIHLTAAYPAEFAVAVFDPDKLEKIIVNILSNAIKFTPANGEVRVQATVDGPFLSVKVADTGPGMRKEETANIFNRFYQADQAADQGSGIGMALVRELIELHRGTINVESQLGAGTTITWNLGIAPDLFEPADFTRRTDLIAANRDGHLSLLAETDVKETSLDEADSESVILIVEDNAELQQFIREILEPNHRVLLAANGREGVGTALEQLPNLIVSDIMMPEMSGLELCKKLKHEEKTSHIPIILLTAKAERQDKLEGLGAGADDYLAKPFDARELALKVDNLIRRQTKMQEKYSQTPWKFASKKITSVDERFLQKTTAAIQQNLMNEYYSVEELAREVGYSRSQLFRKLKALTGKSPLDLIREQRLHYARALLEKGAGNVSEVAYEVGYSNVSYFSRSFKLEFGILPSEVR